MPALMEANVTQIRTSGLREWEEKKTPCWHQYVYDYRQRLYKETTHILY